jgi:hypothetical protein
LIDSPDASGGEDDCRLLSVRRHRIYPALVRLGADDGDLTVKSIFKPLVCQLTRWFLANNSKRFQAKANTDALLSSVLVSI